MRYQRAAEAASTLLSQASRHLLTSNPLAMPELRRAIDESLDWSLDQPHRSDVFGPTFAENRANALGFEVEPGGCYATTADKSELATGAMRDIIGAGMGRDAARWFDARTEPFRVRHPGRGSNYGARFATAVDGGGLVEAQATYGWTKDLTGEFPRSIVEMASIAEQTLPGLVPFYTTIRCGRSAGGQQITFDLTQETSFSALKPLMDAFGLGHRHAGLMTLGAFTLGARFSLPARTSTLTLLRAGEKVEMRLDVNLDALPDAPAALLPLLRLPMAERPGSLAAFDRWLTALTPQGFWGPGSVTVLSIRVREDMPARLAVFLRPISFEPEEPEMGVAEPETATDSEDSDVRMQAAAGEFAAAEMPDWRVY